jgi:hypothetical protein
MQKTLNFPPRYVTDFVDVLSKQVRQRPIRCVDRDKLLAVFNLNIFRMKRATYRSRLANRHARVD